MARREQPDRLGRYELVLPIARGGMGAVYLARTIGLAGFERAVALKLVDRAEEPELARDLVEEAKLAARIHHRHVVGVLDVGIEGDVAFLAMEYVEGPSLASLVKAAQTAGAALPRGVAMRILLDVLDGLHAAHELRDGSGVALGIVHRDVSPANVLVGRDGVSKLTDFGIARALSRSSHTSTGVVKGKFAYMGPEQARGAPLDRRADVWSAGVIAWELLTGAKLFPMGNDASTLLAIVGDDPPYPSTAADDISPELDAAVASALQRNPKARCSSAQALASVLEAACMASGVEIGSHDDVADTVLRLCGPELEARRVSSDAVRLTRSLPSEVHRAQTSTDLLAQPPQLKTIPLERVMLEPTVELEPTPVHAVEPAGPLQAAPVLSMPFPAAPSEPSTFRPASGIIDRSRLFASRTRWATLTAAAMVLGGGLVSAGILSARGSDQTAVVSAGATAAAPASLPRGEPDPTATGASSPPATASASTSASGVARVSTGAAASAASTQAPPRTGTRPAGRPTVQQPSRVPPSKLVEDDPYKREP